MHEELSHGGVVAFAAVRFGRDEAGGVNVDVLEVACPVCGALSVHPVGGGADPARIQLLFLRTIRRRRAILGLPVAVGTLAGAKAFVRNRVEAQDGPTRWRLEALVSEDDPVEP